MILSTYIFGLLVAVYIVLAIFNFFISYKIFKDENEISSLLDFFINSSSLNVKIFQILFGKKIISNKKNLKLLRVNFFLAMLILILLITNIFIKV